MNTITRNIEELADSFDIDTPLRANYTRYLEGMLTKKAGHKGYAVCAETDDDGFFHSIRFYNNKRRAMSHYLKLNTQHGWRSVTLVRMLDCIAIERTESPAMYNEVIFA